MYLGTGPQAPPPPRLQGSKLDNKVLRSYNTLEVERERNSSKDVLLVVCSDKGLIPLLIDRTQPNELAEVLGKEEEILRLRLREAKGVERNASKTWKHPGRRAARETRDVKEAHQRQLRQAESSLKVLRGEELRPIEIVYEDGNPISLRIGNFEDTEQMRWWNFVRSSSLNMVSIYGKDISLAKYLEQVFRLRMAIKMGDRVAFGKKEELMEVLDTMDQEKKEEAELVLREMTQYLSQLRS